MTIDLLAFGAHPDDAELCCGGTLARMAELGYATAIVDLTRGELSTNGTVEERAREAAEAARILGLRTRENLGLPDGGVTASADLAPIIACLRRLRPELVLIPWTRERHPDHEGASALLERALYFAGTRKIASGEPFRPRQVLYYPFRVPCDPSLVIDTSGAWAKKLDAIRAHQSQLRPGTLLATAEAFVEARDRYHGAMLGVSHGEPYVTQTTLGLADPLDHFRRNPFVAQLYR